MRLTEVYTTYENGQLINTVDFEGRNFDSISSAYAECISHDVDCLKSGDATDIEVHRNVIYYTMDGTAHEDVVTLYDGDGKEIPYEG